MNKQNVDALVVTGLDEIACNYITNFDWQKLIEIGNIPCQNE